MKTNFKSVLLMGAVGASLIVGLNSCSESERESGNLGSFEVKSSCVIDNKSVKPVEASGGKINTAHNYVNLNDIHPVDA